LNVSWRGMAERWNFLKIQILTGTATKILKFNFCFRNRWHIRDFQLTLRYRFSAESVFWISFTAGSLSIANVKIFSIILISSTWKQEFFRIFLSIFSIDEAHVLKRVVAQQSIFSSMYTIFSFWISPRNKT